MIWKRKHLICVVLLLSLLLSSSYSVTAKENLLIIDSKGDPVEVHLTRPQREVSTIASNKVDILPADGPIKKISFNNLDLSAPSTLGIDDPPETGAWEELYAINPEDLSFVEATVTSKAKGNQLYKCQDWDFQSQTCNGEWHLFKSIIPGAEYTFTLTPDDPGFGEIVAIDAIHLDQDYNVIGSIFNEVEHSDVTWSPPIYQDEYVRVTFEEKLQDGNIIDVVVRSNRTIAYFDIYEAGTTHRVGRSGIVEYPELQYIILDNLTQPTDTFDFKVIKLLPHPDDDSTNIDPNSISFLEFDYIHDDQINATQADGVIAYCELDVTTPRYRTWNESNNFSVELTDAQSVGGDPTWVVVRSNHERDETIVGTEDASNNINVQIYDTTWHDLTSLSGIANSAYRSFDIGIEDISGDVIVAYAGSGAATTDITYIIWNGTEFGEEQTLTTSLSSEVLNWVSLVPYTGTDSMMLLVHNNINELYVVPWNGSAFATGRQDLTTSTTSNTEEHFAFAWEITTGQGIMAYGESNNLAYKTYSPTPPHWSSAATIDLGANLDSIRMCSDPSSDYIGIIAQDAGNDINVRMWNGTEIMINPPAEDPATESNGVNTLNADCGWHTTGGTALFAYTPNNALLIRYFNFSTATNTWSVSNITLAPDSATFASDDIKAVRFTEHPTTNEIMVVALDLLEDVSALHWDGGGFSTISASPLEGTTEVLNGRQEGAMFDWDRYDPVPNVVDLNASGQTQFAVNEQFNISAIVTDNINISTVTANITYPNNTVNQLTLLDTNGDTIYNATYNQTPLEGVYEIRIVAQDGSVHQNINSSQTLTITVGDSQQPSVTQLIPTAGTQFNLSDNVTISANVTDNSAVSSLLVNVTHPNGTVSQLSTTNTSTIYAANYTTTSALGIYTVAFIANDTSGNINASETTTFSIGDSVKPLVVNVIPLSGTNFDQDSNVTISANVTDNDNVSIVFANITYPNSTITQLTLLDPDSNTIYATNFTNTATTGQYNVTIIANDTSGNVNNSETTTFSIGDAINPTLSLTAPINNFNTTSSSVTFNFTTTDDLSTSLNCSVTLDGQINQTNTSTVNGTPTLVTISAISQGSHIWNTSCSDSQGNINRSPSRTFTVDSTPPTFFTLSTSPSDSNMLDPGVNITVTANVTDNLTSIDTVLLQYKTSAQSTYANTSMQFNTSSNLYYGYFNATTAGTYNLRLFANDTLGTNDTSTVVNITVEFETSWTRSPSSFTPLTADPGVSVNVGNLTINNTGDFTISYNLSSDSNTTFNDSTSFSLTSGNSIVIQVNESAPISGVKIFTVNITSNSSITPFLTTGGTIVTSTNQPVLTSIFTTPSGGTLSVTQGDTQVQFVTKVDNIGNATAFNVSMFLTAPAEWTLTQGNTNATFTEIGLDDEEENIVQFTIPSNATTGTQTVAVNVTGVNSTSGSLAGLLFGDSVEVTVSAASQELGSSSGGGSGASQGGVSASAGGGGGGGGGGLVFGGGPRDLIETQETIDVVRGAELTFPLEITNIYSNAVLNQVNLEVEGDLARHVTFSPAWFADIQFGETENFTITVAVPAYRSEDEIQLSFIITAIAGITEEIFENNVTRTIRTKKHLIERRTVTVRIHEVDEITALEAADFAKTAIKELHEKGIRSSKAEALLAAIQDAVNVKNYDLVQELHEELLQLQTTILEASRIIQEVSGKMDEATDRGLDVSETRRVLTLAQTAFDREDYELALKRARQAEVIEFFETKGAFSFLNFLQRFWWLVMILLSGLVVSGYVTRNKMLLLYLGKRMRSLQNEDGVVHNLMTQLQEDTYKQKTVSMTTYHKKMYQYEKRLAHIKHVISKLRIQKLSILNPTDQLRDLHVEQNNIFTSMKNMQHKYFNEKSVSRTKYDEIIKGFRRRIAEIEEAVALTETKRQLHVSTANQKIGEHMHSTIRNLRGYTVKTIAFLTRLAHRSHTKEKQPKHTEILKFFSIHKKDHKPTTTKKIPNQKKSQPRKPKIKKSKPDKPKPSESKPSQFRQPNELEYNQSNPNLPKPKTSKLDIVKEPEKLKPKKQEQSKSNMPEVKTINPEQYFYLQNGAVIKNIEDLPPILRVMESHVFDHHVNDERNDFAAWMDGVFKRSDMANAIHKKSQKQMAATVERML